MEDLDTLQMELELLLNSVVLRGLNLQRDGAAMDEKPSKPAQTFLKGVSEEDNYTEFNLIFFKT